LAPSFADIFFQNALKNGLLPIVLDHDRIDALFRRALDDTQEPLRIAVDLAAQRLEPSDGPPLAFAIDPFHKHCLLHGLDDIGLTLEHEAEITAYEQRRLAEVPWLF